MDRTLGIGGSDIGIIAGISKYKTPYELYLEKIGETSSFVDNAQTYWGKILEDVIADEFVVRNKVKIMKRSAPKFHKKHPFMMAHVDRLITDGRILECKTARFADDSWGEAGSENVPTSYYLQCQHYMEVFDRDETVLAVLITGSDYREYKIKRNQEIENKIIAMCSQFWDRVQNRNPPPPTNLSDITKLWKYDNGNSKVADEEILDTVKRLNHLKTEIKKYEDESDVLKHALGMFMENSTYLLDSDGKEIATFKSQSRITVDSKKLQSEYPDVYAQCIKTSDSRAIHLKKVK